MRLKILVWIVAVLAAVGGSSIAIASAGTSDSGTWSYSGSFARTGNPLVNYSGRYRAHNYWSYQWGAGNQFYYHSAVVELYNGATGHPDVALPYVQVAVNHSGSLAFTVINTDWTWFSSFIGNPDSRYWGGEAYNVNSTYYSEMGGSTSSGLWGFGLCDGEGCYAYPQWYTSQYTNW